MSNLQPPLSGDAIEIQSWRERVSESIIDGVRFRHRTTSTASDVIASLVVLPSTVYVVRALFGAFRPMTQECDYFLLFGTVIRRSGSVVIVSSYGPVYDGKHNDNDPLNSSSPYIIGGDADLVAGDGTVDIQATPSVADEVLWSGEFIVMGKAA